jgi:PAS domain S-box-containing protein
MRSPDSPGFRADRGVAETPGVMLNSTAPFVPPRSERLDPTLNADLRNDRLDPALTVPPLRVPPDVTSVLARVTDAIAAVDGQGRITYVNPAAEKMAGRPAAKLLGGALTDAFPAMPAALFEREALRAASEGVPVELEWPEAGGRRWLAAKIFPDATGLTLWFTDITARRHALESARVDQQRFRLASAIRALTLYEQDCELRYTWLYPEHAEHAHALGRTDLELTPDGSGALLTRWKREVLATGKEQRHEIHVNLRDGARFYDVFIAPRRDESGAIIGVAGAGFDITPRKLVEETLRRQEQTLRESEACLQAILDNSTAVIYLKDLQGRYVLTNRQHEKLFGRALDEITGQSTTAVFPDAIARTLDANDRAVAAAGIALEFEEIVPHADGPHTYLSVKFPLRNAAGGIEGIAGISTDITERKRIEAQQQALHDLVAAVNRAAEVTEIYDAALEAICRCHRASRASILLYDPDGVMRFKAWRGLSPAYRRAVEGHTPWRRDDPDPQPICVEDINAAPLDAKLRAVVAAEGIRALAFVPLTLDRRLLGKFMMYFDAPRQFTADELRAASAIASQVAFAIERQRGADALESLVAERTASLREAIAQMEEFSYSVSHDLRAPVRALQGYATALAEDYGAQLDARGQDYLARIARNSARMDRLIQDILTYSRLGRRDLELQPVPLGPLIAVAMQYYPDLQPSRAVINVEEPMPAVQGHEASLTQIVSNLLSNAVKFVAPDVTPRVRVWTETRGPDVLLWVEDNGIGVKPEHQSRLFGLFERIYPESKFEGTGIGLAIVRRAAERMGGAAGVESDGVHGSRFWVRLPAALSPPP